MDGKIAQSCGFVIHSGERRGVGEDYQNPKSAKTDTRQLERNAVNKALTTLSRRSQMMTLSLLSLSLSLMSESECL